MMTLFVLAVVAAVLQITAAQSTCPDGFTWDDGENRCVYMEAALYDCMVQQGPMNPCTRHSTMFMVDGLAYPGDNTKYIQCEPDMTCTVASCEDIWGADTIYIGYSMCGTADMLQSPIEPTYECEPTEVWNYRDGWCVPIEDPMSGIIPECPVGTYYDEWIKRCVAQGPRYNCGASNPCSEGAMMDRTYAHDDETMYVQCTGGLCEEISCYIDDLPGDMVYNEMWESCSPRQDLPRASMPPEGMECFEPATWDYFNGMCDVIWTEDKCPPGFPWRPTMQTCLWQEPGFNCAANNPCYKQVNMGRMLPHEEESKMIRCDFDPESEGGLMIPVCVEEDCAPGDVFNPDYSGCSPVEMLYRMPQIAEYMMTESLDDCLAKGMVWSYVEGMCTPGEYDSDPCYPMPSRINV